MSLFDLFNDDNEVTRHLASGMTLAKVTNLEDPDNLGRIKVKFLLRDVEENESCWARVIVPFAGSTKGVYMLPEVDDEVVVAFLGGQLDKPVILGGVWSKTSKPPVDNEKGKNNTKMIKTKSGHTVTFTDEEGKEKIEVKSAKGASITLDDKAESLSFRDKSGNNTITIDGKNGKLSFEAEKKIEFKTGGSTITLDGTGNSIEVKTQQLKMKGMQVELKGDTAVKIESGATLEVKAGAVAQIKGSMVTIN